MQISATAHLQKNVQYEKIPVLLSTVQPMVLICRAGKNSSVHRSIQRMGDRFSKTLQVTIAYYKYIFYFTLSKFLYYFSALGIDPDGSFVDIPQAALSS